VNENRPGVCSKVIKPEEIIEYIETALQNCPEIKIAGIAGPAEPMADINIFYKTYSIIREQYPDLKLCLATNGLVLADYYDLIRELKVDYITVTVNSLIPDTVAQVYEWVEYNKIRWAGHEAGEILVNQHRKALEKLSENDAIFKINLLVIPGVNDFEISSTCKELSRYNPAGVNIVPMLPVKGSKFAFKKEIDSHSLHLIQQQCAQYANILTHCRRCRSDAVGFL
jgi:nitrogen fixation protein NifB